MTLLKTEFICIATSGPSVDDRYIKKEWLADMAETYDPAFYEAKIWPEHNRWQNYGAVVALETRPYGDDDLQLFAELSPNRQMLMANKVWEEKLHGSIEVEENFRKSGKAYLGGLGVTDSPASVGTDRIQFSKRDSAPEKWFSSGEIIQFSQGVEEEEDRFFRKMTHAFSRFFRNEQTTQEDEMDKEKFSALEGKVADLTRSVEELATKFGAAKEETKTEPPTPPADPADARFQELDEKLDAIAASLNTFVDKLAETPVAAFRQDSPGAAGDAPEVY